MMLQPSKYILVVVPLFAILTFQNRFPDVSGRTIDNQGEFWTSGSPNVISDFLISHMTFSNDTSQKKLLSFLLG